MANEPNAATTNRLASAPINVYYFTEGKLVYVRNSFEELVRITGISPEVFRNYYNQEGRIFNKFIITSNTLVELDNSRVLSREEFRELILRNTTHFPI